jgi:hypothetical protein
MWVNNSFFTLKYYFSNKFVKKKKEGGGSDTPGWWDWKLCLEHWWMPLTVGLASEASVGKRRSPPWPTSLYYYKTLKKYTDQELPDRGTACFLKHYTHFCVSLTFGILFRIINILAKAASLRITLNIDGTPIASRSHTHPSHSQTSRLLISSLSLGVPVRSVTQCMRDV